MKKLHFGFSQIGNKPPLWLERLLKAYVYASGTLAPIIASIPEQSISHEVKIWVGVGVSVGLMLLQSLLIFTGKEPDEVQ